VNPSIQANNDVLALQTAGAYDPVDPAVVAGGVHAIGPNGEHVNCAPMPALIGHEAADIIMAAFVLLMIGTLLVAAFNTWRHG
jgi:hypothetical protein